MANKQTYLHENVTEIPRRFPGGVSSTLEIIVSLYAATRYEMVHGYVLHDQSSHISVV